MQVEDALREVEFEERGRGGRLTSGPTEFRRAGPTFAKVRCRKCAHQNRQRVFASQGNEKEIIYRVNLGRRNPVF